MLKQHRRICLDGLTISYQLITSPRKTVAIMIYPDRSIVVRAPHRTSLFIVEDNLKQRTQWIKRHLEKMQQLGVQAVKSTYAEGEMHFYLGEKYPLKLSVNQANKMYFENNCFHIMSRKEMLPQQVKRQLENWYLKQAKSLFEDLMTLCWSNCQHFHPTRPTLKIRKMKSRWGSFSLHTHNVTLNLELIKAPIESIKSVIFHEFCHLKYFNHGRNFYCLLEEVFPSWREQKKYLNMIKKSF